MKYLISTITVKTIGSLAYIKSILVISTLIFVQSVYCQIAELSDYKWEVYNNVKSTIELPNNIENFDWEPRNDPGFGNEGTRPNNKKQYSFVLNNPKSKYFQLTLNESTSKGLRTHIITLIVSDKEFDPTTNSSNRRFKTDKDIIDAMTLQIKAEETASAKQKGAPDKPSTIAPNVNMSKGAENQPTLIEDKINAADKLFKGQDLKGAEKMYKEALLEAPSNPHIRLQLENIATINARFTKEIESLELRQKSYQQNVIKAEEYSNKAEWVMARYYYNEALKYATNPNMVNEALEKVGRKEREQKQIESSFNNFKTKAIEANLNKDYAAAINNWEEALKVKLDDSYAKNELAKSKSNLLEKLAEDARLQKLYEDRKLENEFLTQIGKADVALKNNDFEVSRKEVEKASEIKRNDARIEQKFRFIDQTEITYKETQVALLLKEKEKRYNTLITSAQKQNAAGNYFEAINIYEEAQREKPSDPYPGTQIKSIVEKRESLAKDAEFRKKEAATAALKIQVNKQILIGDKALAVNNLDAAESAFMEAIRLDSINAYPATRLKLIEEKRRTIAAKLEADRQKDENQRVIKFQYDSVLATADAFIANEQFDMAMIALEEVLKIKKNDFIASGKLATAKKRKQEAVLRDLQMIEIAKQGALDSLESLGTKAIAAGNYYVAKDYFTKASEFLPEPSGYTTSQLKYINLTIADLEKKEKEQQDDANFISLVKTADSALLNRDFSLAEEALRKANKIRSDDPNVKSLLFKLTDPNERKRLEMNANRELSNKLVDSAQIQVQEKNYTRARMSLDKATELWPQNNRIAFLKNQVEEGVTGIPTNQKNKAEVKFSFENNRAFRKAGTATSSNSNLQNIKDASTEIVKKEKELIQSNQFVTKTDIEPDKPIASNTIVSKDEPILDTFVGTKAKKIGPVNDSLIRSSIDKDKENSILDNVSELTTSSNKEGLISKNKRSFIESLKIQRAEFPYEPAVLSSKFPDIDFSKPPYGQKFTIDFYNENEKGMNRSKSSEILEEPVNLPVGDSSDKILIQMDNLSFGVYNSYYRITISNFSEKDFVVGYMMLSLERKNGQSTNYEPSYISAFPIVMPGHQSSFVYSTRQILLNNEDRIVLNVFERKNNARFSIELPGELYNNEYDK